MSKLFFLGGATFGGRVIISSSARRSRSRLASVVASMELRLAAVLGGTTTATSWGPTFTKDVPPPLSAGSLTLSVLWVLALRDASTVWIWLGSL